MNEESGASNQTESLGRDREVSAPSLDSVDVGETLRRVRESRGISLHEASMALKLSLKQVEALETNDWSQLPRTVTRGFVRNYARYLELDAGPLMAALDGTQMPRGPELKMAGGAPVSMPREGHGDRRDYARVVAGFVILLLALLAYFFVSTERWQTTLDSIKSMVMGSSVPDNVPVSESTPEPASEAVPVTHGVSSESTSVTPPGGSGSAAPAMPVSTTPAVPAVPATPAPLVPVSGVPSAASAAPSVTVPVVSSAALSFSFTRPSWVEVRDRSGQVIFSQTNPAGSQREVSGQPPFSLIVGNATYVTLQYKGKPINLSSRSRDDVARLTVE